MSSRTSRAVAALAAVLVPSLLAAVPAPAAPAAARAQAAKVTIADLPATADVGQRLTVAGKAKAKKPGKVTVTVQRRYAGSTAWTSVGKDRTDKKGRYSLKVALVQGGPTSFRVTLGSKASPVETLAVYQWLDLADQPQVLFSEGALLHRTAAVGGVKHPESYELPNGFAFLTVKAAGLCTTMEAAVGVLDSEAGGLPDGGKVSGVMHGFTPGSDPVSTPLEAPVGPAAKGAVSLAGKTYALIQVGTNASDPDRWSATILAPRLRCNAAVLPSIEADEVPV